MERHEENGQADQGQGQGQRQEQREGKVVEQGPAETEAVKGTCRRRCCWCNETGHRASVRKKNTAHHSVHHVEEDGHVRHVHCEDETEVGTFDVCILENITMDEHDEDLNTKRDATTIPSTRLTPEGIFGQCSTIMTEWRGVEEQSREARDQLEATETGRGEECTQSEDNSILGAV